MTRHLAHLPALVLFAGLLSLAWAQELKPLERFEYARILMGTEFQILLYASQERTAGLASERAFERIEELDRILSDYREDSELNRVCRTAAESPQVVSSDLFYVLERAQEFSRWTGGAFDVTVRPLVELWRAARLRKQLPSAHWLEEARARVGYQNVLLNPQTRSVRLRVSGMSLDLGGIGKGYAADQALEVLREFGIERALVNAGGDLRLGQPPPGKRGWIVAVDPPRDEGAEFRRTFTLHDCGVATSSDQYQYVEIDGSRYSHIIDPRTGLGLQHGGTVTVVARDALTADALATGLSVLPVEEGIQLVESLDGVEARILRRQGEERQVGVSSGFPP